MADGSAGYYEAGWSNTISSSNIKEFSGPLGGIRFTYSDSRFTNREEGDLIEYYKYSEGTYEIIALCQNNEPRNL